MVPKDCRYAKTHEWVKVENGVATIGISDHAQDALGDITFVELPALGKVLVAGKECGVIESVKAASDIYAPLSGTVVEVNTSLNLKPEIINSEPHGNGWLLKLTNVNESELAQLLDAPGYEHQLENE